MFHYHSLENVHLQDTWLTIGTFDGVHKGHQEIIRHLVSGARKAASQSVVLTFYPHPAITLGKRQGSIYLTTPEDRAELLQSLGVDVVITQKFDLAIAALSADEFISMIKEHLDFTHLVVGYDFALGRGRTGDVKYLKEAGSHSGFSVDVFQPIWSEGETISSSQIRVALIQGKIEKAAQLLGRPYTLSGPVVVGDGRGRLIGIPTANLDFWPEQVLPKIGVYACLAVVGGKSWKAVTNIGFRPTFASEIPAPVVEAHLLDFDGDLYNQELKLKFISRLRDEKKFSGIEALVTQIQQDIQKARHILASIE